MIFDEGSVITLLAYVQKGVILVPGQTMPLHVYRPPVVAMLRTVIEDQKTIAILHVRFVVLYLVNILFKINFHLYSYNGDLIKDHQYVRKDMRETQNAHK